MTVSTTTNRASYSGNGSTTAFAYGFKIFADADLTVIIRSSAGVETTKTLTTHYTVSGAGTDSGGNVTFTTGNVPASGETVVILRKLTLTQATDYVANDPFPAESHEDALDRLTMITQQLDEAVGRSLKVSQTNVIATSEFTTSASDRANKLLSFDGSGDLTVTAGKVDTVTISASGLSAGATPTATATYTAASGALALALGIPAGATGATGATGASGGGLSDVVLDTTPQLGGDLDMNGQDIVTTSNATIDLAPNGTGTVVVKGNTNPGTIVFNCESNSHGQTVKAQPHSAAVTNTLTLPPGGDGEIVSTVATQQLTNKVIPDDQNLSFGTDSDAFIKYDETTTDHLKIGGAVTTFEKAAVGATDTDTTNTGNVTLDFDASQNFVLTLTGNVTLVNPNTENVGQSGFIVFIQDATGGRTVSTSTDYETAGGAGLTLSSAASTTDIVPYVVAAGNRILLGAPQLAFA
jgi:methyl coenzyme M reductase subunit D